MQCISVGLRGLLSKYIMYIEMLLFRSACHEIPRNKQFQTYKFSSFPFYFFYVYDSWFLCTMYFHTVWSKSSLMYKWWMNISWKRSWMNFETPFQILPCNCSWSQLQNSDRKVKESKKKTSAKIKIKIWSLKMKK